MKPHSNTFGGTFHWAPLVLGDVATAVGHTATRMRKGAKNLIVQTQIARMQSVLHAMDDELLDQIGITRSGISKHAEHLITGENDGL